MSESRSTHRIERQILEIEVADQDEGRRLHSALSRLQRQQLEAIIERALDALAGPETILRLDHVTIDLGEIQAPNLEGALANSLRHELPRALAESVARGDEGGKKASRFDRDHPRSACEELEVFARTGTLPWSSTPADARHLHRRVEELVRSSPQALARTLRGLLDTSKAALRIAAHFPNELLAKLVDLLLSPARLRPLRRPAAGDGAAAAAEELRAALAGSGDLAELTHHDKLRKNNNNNNNAHGPQVMVWRGLLVAAARTPSGARRTTLDTYAAALAELSRVTGRSTSATLRRLSDRAAGDDPEATVEPPFDITAELERFARTGLTDDGDRLRRGLLDLLSTSPGAASQALRRIVDAPGALERIAAYFPGDTLVMLADELLGSSSSPSSTTAEAPPGQANARSLVASLADLAGLHGYSAREREQLAWRGLLGAAARLAARPGSTNQTLTKAALVIIARATGRPPDSLLGTADATASPEPATAPDDADTSYDHSSGPRAHGEYSADEALVIEAITAWSEAAAAAVSIISPPGAPQGPPSDAARRELRSLIEAVIALGHALDAAPKASAQALLLAHHAAAPVSRECAQFSLMALGAGAAPKMSKDSASAIARGLEQILQVPPSPARTEAPPAPTKEKPKKKPRKKPEQAPRLPLVDREPIHVDDAGIILLWPFLPYFFAHVDLMEGPNFRDERAQLRAAALLRVAAAGDVDVAEYQLPLAKLLSGLELDAVFDLDSPLQEAEVDECAQMLEALIARATILKDMSVGGLRGSFLLRPGILSVRDNGWLLRVERRPYDLILDRFPWAFEWVKLPWMGAPVQVEW